MSHLLSGTARLLRALAAVAVLAVLTVGLPLALWRFGAPYLPDHVPSLRDAATVLTSRDTGEVFLGFLILVGFAAWVVFAASVLLEVASLLRRRPMPAPRGLGWSRGVAAALLATALLDAGAGPGLAAAAVPLSSVLTTPPDPTLVMSGQASPGTGPVIHTADTIPADDPAGRDREPTGIAVAGPSYPVRAGDSLWSIATRQLHNPDRWEEIFQLNAGRPQPDGATLTDPALLRPGWTLTLPADATHPPTYTVAAGDTLSTIAGSQLGDPTRWDTLFRLNTGRAEPDGGVLSDPNLIRSGWRLDLPDPDPAAGNPPPAAGSDPPATPDNPAHTNPAGPPPVAGESPPGPVGGAVPGDTTARPGIPSHPAPATDPATGPPTATPSGAPDRVAPTFPGPAARAAGQEPAMVTPAALTLGISSLAAAGLLAIITARRFRTARRRRPGHRMRNTAALGVLEADLRAREEPDTVARLDLALRTLSTHLGATGQPLPNLLAATVAGQRVGLRLAQPADPVAPFIPGPTPVDWHLDPRAVFLDPDHAAAIPAPYPALATLGRGPGGELVLADLESAGALTLTGDPTQVGAVLTALAIDLAVSGWADHLDVTLVGFGVRLAEVLPDRIRYTADLDDALHGFTARAQQVRDALAGVADTAPDARGRGIADDTWIPSIILTAEPVTPTQQQRIRELIALSPRSSLAAVIAAGDDTHRLPGPWQITIPDDPTTAVSIDALDGTPVVLQRCDTDTYHGVLDDLDRADDDTQDPAHGHQAVPDEPAALPDPSHRHTTHLEPVGGLDDTESEFDDELGLREPPPPTQPAPPVTITGPADGPAANAPADTTNGHPAPGVDTARDNHSSPGVDGADTSAVPADKPTHELGGGQPVLRLLGPIEINGVDPAAVADSKRNRLIELAAYLALHPGRSGDEVSHTLGDPTPWTPPTRQAQMSRLRNWLGTTPDGEPYVAPVTAEPGYRLSPKMGCDWTTFQHLAHRGLSDPAGPQPPILEAALDLVRGQPFTGAPAGRYAWADLIRHEMLAAITDVAHTLAHTYQDRGDLDHARHALHRALGADPVCELLHRDLCRIEHHAGDLAAVHRIADQIHTISADLDVDPEPETTHLLRQLLDPRYRAGFTARPAPGGEPGRVPGPRVNAHSSSSDRERR